MNITTNANDMVAYYNNSIYNYYDLQKAIDNAEHLYEWLCIGGKPPVLNEYEWRIYHKLLTHIHMMPHK